MIRTAKLTDLEQCLTMLIDFATASVYDYSEWQEEDLDHARNVLINLMHNEYLKVIDINGDIVGMIGAAREQDPWIRRRSRIRELFWWVKPEYRNTRWSLALFIQWQEDADRWIEKGLVDQVSLSLQPTANSIRLNKRGWQCVEQHWVKG